MPQPYPEPHRSRIPHPAQVVPKIVLLVCALFVFGHLIYQLTNPDLPPRPVRVSLAHAGKDFDPLAVLQSGLVLPSPLELALTPTASRVDYPLGGEQGALTYNARPFLEANHLGEDFNGIGGGDSDLGDPVFAIGPGKVLLAADVSKGWGNVVILQHRSLQGQFFQSFYAHLDAIHVAVGDTVARGTRIGSVGTAHGSYLAHLHFEIRDGIQLAPGAGYAPFPLDRLPGEAFLREFGGSGQLTPLPALESQIPQPLSEDSLRVRTSAWNQDLLGPVPPPED